MDALVATIDKALGYPKPGVRVGGGIHVPMPDTWDGTGPTPPGWTKSASAVWVASPTDAAVPLSDSVAAELQRPDSQARLTGSERAAIAVAIAGRSDIELGDRTPKAKAVQGAAEKAKADG